MKTVLCKDYVGFFSWSFEWKGECVESFAYTETNGQMCFFRERTVKTIQQRVKGKKSNMKGKFVQKMMVNQNTTMGKKIILVEWKWEKSNRN